MTACLLKDNGGSSIQETVRSIHQRIGENSVWCLFLLKGSKGGKLALTDHDEVYCFVHYIAERAHGREYTVASCREAIGSYLKNAPARKGGKKHNQSNVGSPVHPTRIGRESNSDPILESHSSPLRDSLQTVQL